MGQFSGHNGIYYTDHRNGIYYPQSWLTQYYQDLSQLMLWLQSLKKSNICVIWKTNNIGIGEGKSNHPSQVNKAHDWLNRWTVAMAESMGVSVYDVTPYTIGESSKKAMSNDYYHSYNHTNIAVGLLDHIQL